LPVDDGDLNRAELHLRQLAAVASEHTTGFGLNECTYAKVESALDENGRWVDPSGRTFMVYKSALWGNLR
jgi:hypothetical protein